MKITNENLQICGKKIELILTDGWYPIRTSIDQLLSQQIYKGKLVVGTKLMIQGAEILDCDDGCHPLDVSFNCFFYLFF